MQKSAIEEVKYILHNKYYEISIWNLRNADDEFDDEQACELIDTLKRKFSNLSDQQISKYLKWLNEPDLSRELFLYKLAHILVPTDYTFLIRIKEPPNPLNEMQDFFSEYFD